MAVEGEIKNISLSGIVQLICLERRTAELFLERRGEDGVVFFEKGQIVHARTGGLTGEEAFYQLLTWTEGTFRISDKIAVLTRTINSDWNHLLMEGARVLDERRSEVGRPPTAEFKSPVSVADVERDKALGDDLMLLIGQLEQYVPQFSEKKVVKRPVAALELLCELVNRVIETAERMVRGDVAKISLDGVLAKLYDKYTSTRILNVEKNYLSIQTALNMYKNWAGDARERARIFHSLSSAMIDITEHFFTFMIASLRLLNIRDEVEETFGVFIADLRRAADGVKY